MSQQDWMLMHRVAAGDEGALGELYDRFSPLVYKVAWQFQPSHAEAEDAVQEIFVRLWRTADRFDPRRAKLVTWVMLIARRHLIDRLRRNSVRPSASSFEGDLQSPGDDVGPGRAREGAEALEHQVERRMGRRDRFERLQDRIGISDLAQEPDREVDRPRLLGAQAGNPSRPLGEPFAQPLGQRDPQEHSHGCAVLTGAR